MHGRTPRDRHLSLDDFHREANERRSRSRCIFYTLWLYGEQDFLDWFLQEINVLRYDNNRIRPYFIDQREACIFLLKKMMAIDQIFIVKKLTPNRSAIVRLQILAH